MLALDSMARLWFKRTDKHINKTASYCEMSGEIETERGWKTTHESKSERWGQKKVRTTRRGLLWVNSRLVLDLFAVTFIRRLLEVHPEH